MDRIAELRDDFDLLGLALRDAEGAAAAAIARERRIIGAELERWAVSEQEVSVVDDLAAKRAGDGRPPARRRKSG